MGRNYDQNTQITGISMKGTYEISSSSEIPTMSPIQCTEQRKF